jgi:hypothetical protein
MKKWYNWPANYYEKSWKPWHGILRTFVFAPLVFIGFGILYVGVILTSNIDHAEDVRKELF